MRYLLAILAYRPCDSISTKKFRLVGILPAYTSILCSAQSLTVLRNIYIASLLIEVFYTLFATARLSQKKWRWVLLIISIHVFCTLTRWKIIWECIVWKQQHSFRLIEVNYSAGRTDFVVRSHVFEKLLQSIISA